MDLDKAIEVIGPWFITIQGLKECIVHDDFDAEDVEALHTILSNWLEYQDKAAVLRAKHFAEIDAYRTDSLIG